MASSTYASAKLDLKNRSVICGAQRMSSPSADDRLVLLRQRVELSILLPLGAETGLYEFQILREVGQLLITKTGVAERVNGDKVVRVRTDFRSSGRASTF